MKPRAALAALLLIAAGMSHPQAEYPTFVELNLRSGREVWLGTCMACHASDIAGAPQVTDSVAWAPRLQQGKEVLYEHALNGLHGANGTEMPPRGGNLELTDEQVRTAVDYMVALVIKLSGEQHDPEAN
jgi:cytochrome c5